MDARRDQSTREPAGGEVNSSSSTSDESDKSEVSHETEKAIPGQKTSHKSIKYNFLKKVLSPVIGYSTDYELLHFVFDLQMWTTLGTKKNVGRRYKVPLRLMLKDTPFSTQYWRLRHLAVIDLQKQV
eukprot:3025339-Karenia_brevis.AAC.1